MNVCVAHLQMNACVAKNFGAWTEKVGHPCPTFMAHPTRVGRRVGALHKKLGHPWFRDTSHSHGYRFTEISKNFLINVAVHQGTAFSFLLFIFIMDGIIKGSKSTDLDSSYRLSSD